MRKWSKPYPLLLLLVIPLMGWIYVWINREPSQIHLLVTDLDGKIPFLKGFIIPYMIWMPFLYLTLIYFYFRDRSLYYRTLVTYTVCVLICYSIYMIFQTTVPREAMLGEDLLSRMVLFIYTNDAPFNCFPSIHCLTSYLLLLAASRSEAISRRAVSFIGIISWSIIASTVFVKQHVVLDVFAGVALAHVVFAVVQRIAAYRTSPADQRKRMPVEMSS